MSDTPEIVKAEPAEIVRREPARSLLDVIADAATDPRVDVEKMERLLAMQQTVLQDQRKIAFMGAMARLQAKLPQMEKYGQAKNSKFARLEDMDVVIRPLLAAEGFSLSFDEESHTEKTVTFIMSLSHVEGHSDSKRLTVPIDLAAINREGKSIRPSIQDAGSTVTYARRYLLKMHLNIVEKGEDTDGENLKPITENQVLDLKALIEEVGANLPRFLTYMGVDNLESILARDYTKAVTSLETKRRAGK